MLCPNCGIQNTESGLFCLGCGGALEVNTKEPEQHHGPPSILDSSQNQSGLKQSEVFDPLIGKIIDNRYRIESQTGIGGMGTNEHPLPGIYQTPGSMPTVGMSTPHSRSHSNAPDLMASAPNSSPRSSARTILLAFMATILLIGIGGGGAWLLFGNKSEDSDNKANANDNKEESSRSDVNRQNNNYAPSTITTPTPMFTPTPMATPSPINTSAARAEVMSVMNRWVDSLRRRNLYDNLRLYRDQLDVYYQYQDVGKEKVRASRQSYFDKYNANQE